MPLASNSTIIGIAKEATKGTGVAATAFIPVTSFDPVDNIIYLEDNGMRGADGGPFNVVAGAQWATFSMGGDAFPDTFPWLTSGILGDITESGASAPFTHTSTLKNSADMQPGSKTLTDYYGFAGTHTRQYAGVQFHDLSLKFNADGKLEYTAAASGLAISTLVAKPTPTFGVLPPYPSWVGTVTVAGGLILNCQVGELTIKRNANIIHSVDGSAAPYAVFVGPVVVEGKMTIIAEIDTELNRYLSNTQPSLVFNWTTGAAAALTQIRATMSKVAYTTGAIKRGNDYITTEIGYKAIMNTTDVGPSAGYSPIAITTQNAIAANIYQ